MSILNVKCSISLWESSHNIPPFKRQLVAAAWQEVLVACFASSQSRVNNPLNGHFYSISRNQDWKYSPVYELVSVVNQASKWGRKSLAVITMKTYLHQARVQWIISTFVWTVRCVSCFVVGGIVLQNQWRKSINIIIVYGAQVFYCKIGILRGCRRLFCFIFMTVP